MGNRIYYAVQQVGIGNATGGSVITIHGLQSVGVTTNFTTVNVQELGQLAIYDNREENCEVQINLKKVLDGYPLIYTSATASGGSLSTCANQQCSVGLSISDDVTNTAASSMSCTGLYISSAKYNFNTEGNFEEEVSFIGNHKAWGGASAGSIIFAGSDKPLSDLGVSRRQDINISACSLPTGIPANSHITSISTSVNINRESLYKLGKKYPYFRAATFPIETSTEISINATSGDGTSVTQVEILCTKYENTSKETITIATCEGTTIALGSGNRLASVNYSGGDAGGGIVKVSYTYKGYNDFSVTHT